MRKYNFGVLAGMALIAGATGFGNLEARAQNALETQTNSASTNSSVDVSTNNLSWEEQAYINENQEYFFYDAKKDTTTYFDYVLPVLFAGTLRGDSETAKVFEDYYKRMQREGFRYSSDGKIWKKKGEVSKDFLEWNAKAFILATKRYQETKERFSINEIEDAARQLVR